MNSFALNAKALEGLITDFGISEFSWDLLAVFNYIQGVLSDQRTQDGGPTWTKDPRTSSEMSHVREWQLRRSSDEFSKATGPAVRRELLRVGAALKTEHIGVLFGWFAKKKAQPGLDGVYSI